MGNFHKKAGWGLVSGAVAVAVVIGLTASGGAATDGSSRCFGMVTAFYEAALGINYPGIVREIKARPGTVVKTGDVIVQLEDAAETLEVARRELVWKDKSELEAAQKRRDLFVKDLAITQKLFDTSKSVSREDLDKKELECRLAEAEAQRLSVAESREEIEYKLAVDQLAHRQLRAPVDGAVTKVFIEKGEYAQPQQPLVQLVNLDECYFISNVPEEGSGGFREGTTLPIEFQLPERALIMEGKVVYVSPMIDPASGLREVKLLFTNVNHAVSPGEKGSIAVKKADAAK